MMVTALRCFGFESSVRCQITSVKSSHDTLSRSPTGCDDVCLCLSLVRARSELQNLKLFTQIKSFKPNFTPKKTCKFWQILHSLLGKWCFGQIFPIVKKNNFFRPALPAVNLNLWRIFHSLLQRFAHCLSSNVAPNNIFYIWEEQWTMYKSKEIEGSLRWWRLLQDCLQPTMLHNEVRHIINNIFFIMNDYNFLQFFGEKNNLGHKKDNINKTIFCRLCTWTWQFILFCQISFFCAHIFFMIFSYTQAVNFDVTVCQMSSVH